MQTKSLFNPDIRRGNYAIHCRNYKELKVVMHLLHQDEFEYQYHGHPDEDVFVYFNSNMISSKLSCHYTPIEYDDYAWK